MDLHVTRLWSRTGLRLLSVFVLALGLILGASVTVARHQQQLNAAADARTAQEMKVAQLRQAAYLAAAPELSARAAAQKAADGAAASAANSASTQAKKAEQAAKAAAGGGSTPTTVTYGPIPSSCKAYSGNRAIGCAIVVSEGLSLEQMVCLDRMWTHESNWRTTAKNSSSGSYGIPQALPANKMANKSQGGAPDYLTNPATQIRWGIWYSTHRYGSPCDAWTFWQAHSFY
jgi:hypothetical protein